MKALKIVGIILLAAVVICGIAVFMQPDRGHIEKSIVINAPPANVYKEINGFNSMNKWSPWMKLDPEAQYKFEGPESGVGAKMSWDGKKVGKGSQWIAESVENQKVKNALAFNGSDVSAYAEFILTPTGGGTTVTWTFDGKNDGVGGKAMWLFMSGMMNDMYEQGLIDLKGYIESIPPPSASTAKP